MLLSRAYRAFHCGPLPASPGLDPISASPANPPNPGRLTSLRVPGPGASWLLHMPVTCQEGSCLPVTLMYTGPCSDPCPSCPASWAASGVPLRCSHGPPAQPACDVWCLPRGQSSPRPGPTVMCVPCHVPRLSLTEVGE